MPLSAPHLSVLIVDDEDDALALTRSLVEKADPAATITAVHGAREAMGYLLRATNPVDQSMIMPALVLVDLNMPGMNGFELLRWIRRNQSLSALKVVILSTSDSPFDIKHASEFGAHGYLIKFPHPSCLAALLKQVAGSASPFSVLTDNAGSAAPTASPP